MPETGVSLLAIGNRSDLIVFGSNNVITSAQLSVVRKAANARETNLLTSKDSVLFQSEALDGNVLFVALSPNEKNLFVYTESATIYHFTTSSLNQSNFTGNAIKLDNVFSEENPIISLLARPQHSNEVLILTQFGDVYLLDVTASNNAQKLASSVVAISWSPQGKAFLTGTNTRELIQYKIDGSVFAKYNLPDEIGDDFSIFSVFWKYSNKLSVTTYNGDDAFKFSLVSVTKSDASSTWLTSEEVSQPFGDASRYPFSYNIFLKDYEPSIPFFIATSSQSSELSLLSDNNMLLPDEDSARAEFPLGEDDNDISPMGIALDYTSDILVPDVLKGFEDDVTVPIVWVLDNMGSLLSWNIAYRKGIKEGTAKLENILHTFEAACEDGSNSVSIFTSSPSTSNNTSFPSTENKPLAISSTQSTFGQLPAFGQTSTFGQSAFSPTESKSTFGQSGFAKYVPISNEASSQSAFGQSSFGQNSFASKVNTSSPVTSSTTKSAFGAFSSSGSAFGNQNSSTISSPFASVASTSGSPFATAAAGKSSDFSFGTETTSPFVSGTTSFTSNNTSIFNSSSNKSAFGVDGTSGSVFGTNDNTDSAFNSNKDATSVFGANKDKISAFPTSSNAGSTSFNIKSSASQSFRTSSSDKGEEDDIDSENDAWVDEEDIKEEKDVIDQTSSFSGFNLKDTKPVLSQNKPLSLFSGDQLKSNPFGSSNSDFPSMSSMSISESSNNSNVFGSFNSKKDESGFTKNVTESTSLSPNPVKTVAESAPLPPDPVKTVAESAPLPPDPVKTVAESAPLPPDPVTPKRETTVNDLETSPGSSSSSSGVLVFAPPDIDTVVVTKNPTNEEEKTGLFSIHDTKSKPSTRSGFTSIHDVNSKSDSGTENCAEKITNKFEALETSEDENLEKDAIEESESLELIKDSESSDESKLAEVEPEDDSTSFDKVLDDIDDPYVKAYLKKKLVKDLSDEDLKVLEEHDAPPIEYLQTSTQFPEPQKYTVEDYFYEPLHIEDSELEDELESYKQYTIPKYYEFDPSLIPAVGDSYESEAINLFSEINGHYEILARNSKAITRVISLNKPEVDEDGVLIEREAHTEDDLERFNEWKISEAFEVKGLWENIQKEVDELKKSLDIKIDDNVENSLAKINDNLAEIKKAIQYHETFLADEHVSLGGLPAHAALAQKELRKNLKKVKDELSVAEQKIAAVKSASNGGGVTINSLQNFIQKLSLGILKQHDVVEDITKRLHYFQINGGPNRSLLVGADSKSLLLADETNNSISFFDANEDSAFTRRNIVFDSERVNIVEYKQRQLARKKLTQTLKARDMRTLINTNSTLRGSRK